ncbi:hypothetical protein BK643_05895 [Pseudomonas protegens]|nr:hypothetical protein BK643_05895 [Pseudomonas protegens]
MSQKWKVVGFTNTRFHNAVSKTSCNFIPESGFNFMLVPKRIDHSLSVMFPLALRNGKEIPSVFRWVLDISKAVITVLL